MFDFPNSPTNGQQVTGPGGVVYTWDGVKYTTATGGGNVAFAPLNNPVFVGDPQAPTPAQGDADTSIATTAFVAPLTHNVGRNLLHNGLFNIAQRGTGPWTTYSYTADRWQFYTSGTCSVSVNAMSVAGMPFDDACRYVLYANFTGASSAGSQSVIYQKIEGVRRLSNQTVTLSFYAQAGAAGLKLGANIDQYFGSGGSPSATASVAGQQVTLTTSWARYSLTFAIPAIAGKTLGTNGDDQSTLQIWYTSASDNAFRSGNVGVQTGTVNLWGVQLEIGSVATPLEKLDPQTDLANCQRFYQVGTASQIFGVIGASSPVGSYLSFPVAMRSSPTMAVTGTPNYNNASAAAAGDISPSGFSQKCTTSASGAGWAIFNWTASADL